MNRQQRTVSWLSSLYFAKGMPRVVVFVIALLLLCQMGFSTLHALCCVSLFYLPWVLKAWWKPCVGQASNYRLLILVMQFMLALAFAMLAFLLSTAWMVVGLLMVVSWLAAVHNVAADGFARLHPLSRRHTLVRELFRKFSLVVGQGVLLVLAGNLQVFFRHDLLYSWRVLFYTLAGIYLLLFFWHVWTLPYSRHTAAGAPPSCRSTHSLDDAGKAAAGSGKAVFFLLCYAFAQGMVGKGAILFLLDTFRHGGLGLSPQEFGFVMGIVGIAALTVGGLLGNKAVRHFGFTRCLWPMAASMLIPCVVYVAISYWQPRQLLIVGTCVLAEQLAYGFGFAAYLSFLKQVPHRERGKSLMAFSLMSGCLASGVMLQMLDYNAFFVAALALSVLTPVSSLLLRKNPTYK